MSKTIAKLTIADYIKIDEVHFILVLQKKGSFPFIKPGQFVSILIDNSSVYLRRPFSIHDINEEQQTLSILIKVVGKGTKYLQEKKIGETLDVMFPLGNGYNIETNDKVLLIGGGFGIAPLFFLAKQLEKYTKEIHLLVGARSKRHVLLTDKFKDISTIHITTEDASLGEKGYVTDHSILKEHFDKIYTCGPHPMTKAIAQYAIKRNIPCEVSLENKMACSYGVCLCCVTETLTNENVTTCLEGPVFNAKKLKW